MGPAQVVRPSPTARSAACSSSELVSPLRAHIEERLPAYMVPSAWVFLDAMPLTPNGKLDRRSLPAPSGARPDLEGDYVAPRSAGEQRLAEIWTEVLGVERIGVHDNFFALGGHSLMATQVISRVRSQFELEIPLRDLFQSPTIARLAERIVEAQGRGAAMRLPPIERVDRTSPLPLSFAQERLWFLDQLIPDNPFYNIPGAMRLRGALNVDAVQRAFAEVVRRHEALRTTFERRSDRAVQVILPEGAVEVPLFDLTDLPESERETAVRQRIAADARRPFDLTTRPLLRASLYRVGTDDHVLFWALHHIVADGWSLGVLRAELTALYAAFSAGRPSPLPELTVQYGDFAVWQRRWLTGDLLKDQLDYWRAQLADVPVLNLPTDHPRPAVQTFRGDIVSAELPRDLTAPD